MVDYSEFPTTPTGWQERQDREWAAIAALETEDAQRAPRRRVDLVALVPGLAFVVLAFEVLDG